MSPPKEFYNYQQMDPIRFFRVHSKIMTTTKAAFENFTRASMSFHLYRSLDIKQGWNVTLAHLGKVFERSSDLLERKESWSPQEKVCRANFV